MPSLPERLAYQPEPVSPQLLSAIRSSTAVAACIIGLLGLAGWVFHVEALKTILPAAASMKVNTALGFLLLGSSLLIAPRRPSVAASLAAAGLMLGALTLCEYAAGIDLGIDQLLTIDRRSSQFPGRMAPATAFAITLLGAGVLVTLRGNGLFGQLFAIPPGAVAALAIVGYLHRADSLYELFAFSSVAIHTACGIILLVVSLLFLAPHQGFMHVFNGDSLGSITARRLLPPAICAPVLFSYVSRLGERAGYYDTNVAAAIVSLSMMITMGILIHTAALKLHGVDLDRRHAVLAEAKISHRLRRANIELQQFAYSVSHDIRGPLATIIGLAGLAVDDIRDRQLGDAHQSVTEIRRCSLSLSRLVQDTLALTDVDAAESRLLRCSMAQMAREVIHGLERTAADREVTLSAEAEGPAEIETDPIALQCVLRNLVENGIKYHDPGKASRWVRVSVRGDESEGVRIEVADNGLGIPESARKDVFKVYRRFHPEVAEGSGVGLALVRRQIACLGGRVEFKSRDDGTTFTVRLPPPDECLETGDAGEQNSLSAV